MKIDTLLDKRKVIIEELVSLDRMRRGSIVEQYVETKNKKGEIVRRGPYPLYTYKERGKTVSRRLKNPQEVKVYRRQIETFRRFEALTSELRKIGEALCKQAETDLEKKRPRSPLSRTKR